MINLTSYSLWTYYKHFLIEVLQWGRQFFLSLNFRDCSKNLPYDVEFITNMKRCGCNSSGTGVCKNWKDCATDSIVIDESGKIYILITQNSLIDTNNWYNQCALLWSLRYLWVSWSVMKWYDISLYNINYLSVMSFVAINKVIVPSGSIFILPMYLAYWLRISLFKLNIWCPWGTVDIDKILLC